MEINTEKLRDLRLSRGWSQEHLAQTAGTTTRTIQRLESGNAASMETIKAVASAFDLDFQELLTKPSFDAAVHAEREQREKDFARHAGIRSLEEDTVSRIVDYWNEKTPGYGINGAGRLSVEKWISDFSIQEVMAAMDASARQYLKIGQDDRCIGETVELAFSKVPAICFVNRRSSTQPAVRDLYLLRGVFRNRIPGYFDNGKAAQWLSAALNMGVPAEELRSLASDVRNWTQFRAGLEELAERHRALQEEIHPPKQLVASAPPSEYAPAETSASPQLAPTNEARRGPLDYAEDAIFILKRCRAQGHGWITIDFEERSYYFGRSPDGWGTSYPIDNTLALDELAGAIEKRFEFIARSE